MKKTYVKPMLHAETFVPNHYATMCKPGVDETKATPIKQTCWYKLNPQYGSCSDYNENFYILTENTSGCELKLTSSGSVSTQGTGISEVKWDFQHPYNQHNSCKVDAYKWKNGTLNGAHYIPKSEFGGVDGETGLPLYFNS